MKYLVNVVETYRIATEKEAEEFLKELKSNPSFTVSKYSSVKKERKQKGDVIDEWIRFSVTKTFNEEKEPDSNIEISYERKDF